MTRLIIGPFNRVEGDLEVRLEIADGVVATAEVSVPLYRGFEQILDGRPALDALALAPRICGICSVSQSIAAVAALRGALGIAPAPNGVLTANIAHAAENAADHLTHFYIFFMPDFARDAYAAAPWHQATAARFAATTGSASRDALPARARLLEIMGIIAGKWPHSLAFQPGGTTRAIDLGERIRLLSIVGGFRSFLETSVFGDRLEAVLALDTIAAFDRWRDGRAGDLGRFLAIADALQLDRLGKGPGTLMSFGAYHGEHGALFERGIFDQAGGAALATAEIAEDVSHAWMRDGATDPALSTTIPDADKPGAYSWAKAPRLGGRPVEVGALARQAVNGNALLRALVSQSGSNVRNRVIARLLETAHLALAMETWVRALRLNEPFCADVAPPDEGRGAGMVEAARGSLGHWIELRHGKIARYQIIAPTTWNFSPRDADGQPGPLEQALVGTAVGSAGAESVAVQHVVRSFDPCMVCTAH
ncbi:MULTISPECIES: nickel-dependent hydrogenase large subunit [Rhodopseudomonas]|uniref:HupV protein n=1 Tax=Rhodopseudomonas palustris TaxID=1076 RepID=A0A0D7EWT6_RHOPL|nr:MULTISPECIES: nickel-dependent hydrogenase large subunit [Rhodopseudomonas]KIZ45015.1 HupV protein [Rhodopseudomonas palustris]MDF3809549.1 nickel-dependent hydrogenase large subunit [Rhodopseudomonas sp. BAL398]WOK17747.1 nickel-dependent hydrogenase large subunit [Rhodopseudomonas sp. BAL398]